MSGCSKASSVWSPGTFPLFPPLQFRPPRSASSAPVGVCGGLHVSPQSSPRPIHQHLPLFPSLGTIAFSGVPLSSSLMDPLHLLLCLLLSLAP